MHCLQLLQNFTIGRNVKRDKKVEEMNDVRCI